MRNPGNVVRNSPIVSTHRRGSAWRRVAPLAMLLAALLIVGRSAANAAPPQAQQVQALRGCCLCRGPLNGKPHASLSCTDNLAVEACELKCKGASATSLLYGSAQSCSSGCAGLASQSVK